MKTIYLVRHAKSSWGNPDLSDFDCPLNKRGERDAPDMGSRLRGRAIMPGLILSSPANRAISTARIIAQKIGYELSGIRTDQAVYHASTSHLLKIIKIQQDKFSSFMLLGHNPGLTDLGNSLSGNYLENIPTCGVLALRFKVNTWSEIDKTGEVLFYDFPKRV